MTTGDAVVLSCRDATVLLPAGADDALLDRLRLAVADGRPFESLVAVLGAAGVSGLPPFCGSVREGDLARVLARGDATVEVRRHDGEVLELRAADGVSTWREEVVRDASALTLRAAGVAAVEVLLGGTVAAVVDPVPSPVDVPAGVDPVPSPVDVPAAGDLDRSEDAADPLDPALRAPGGTPAATEAGEPDVPSPLLPPPAPPPRPIAGSAPEPGPASTPSTSKATLLPPATGVPTLLPVPSEPEGPASTPPPPPSPPAPPTLLGSGPPPPSLTPVLPPPGPEGATQATMQPPAGDGDGDDFDFSHLLDHTQYRSVEAAAVRGSEPDAAAPPAPAGRGLIDSVPPSGAARPGPAPQGAPPPSTGPAGDHDGHTMMAGLARPLIAAAAPPTGTPAAGSALTVQAVFCGAGHPNPPHGVRCRVCSGEITDRNIRPTSRPPLGRLRLSTGVVIDLDRPQLIGRRPTVANPNATQELPGLVTIPDPQQALSRVHVEVRIEGWEVYVVDRQSKNGTTVEIPGQRPQKLRANEPCLVVPGTRVNLADVASFEYELVPA